MRKIAEILEMNNFVAHIIVNGTHLIVTKPVEIDRAYIFDKSTNLFLGNTQRQDNYLKISGTITFGVKHHVLIPLEIIYVHSLTTIE
jgi:hypothetical protein